MAERFLRRDPFLRIPSEASLKEIKEPFVVAVEDPAKLFGVRLPHFPS